MMYRPHPDGGDPYVDVSAEEINARRAFIREAALRYGVRIGDAEDIVQDVMIAAYESARDCKIRGSARVPPEKTLEVFLRAVTWFRASNYRRRHRNRYEYTGDVDKLVGSIDPREAAEARDLLRAVARMRPKAANALLLALLGFTVVEAAKESGRNPSTHHRHVQELRRLLRTLGAEPAPKQAPRPGWKQRKRGR
ncbi:sigma-70 family RNA polymerase sigma factor [Polyangium spumosum]|uniref:Sigma-70 family RNA polymerase sigma factor n=1 Tax=Polyangium spumosum TaxID=889282 RepID=A0A6N7PNE2_9BACT|nr:sigma-70 family RNA polymerase sigma factor [Polyangium spumosum]MRG91664.1 hypothetical protein [Polyangium spumosum]